MQNSVNHRTFERNWRFQVPPGSMFLRVAPPPAWARALRACPIVAAARRAAACSIYSLQRVVRRLKERASPSLGSAARVAHTLCVCGSRPRRVRLSLSFLSWVCFLSAASLTDAGSGRLPTRFPTPCVHRLLVAHTELRHRMKQGYPLNLSISLSGGEETNQDAPSNGE